MLSRALFGLVILMPMLGRAQAPVRLDNDDVQFQFAGLAVESSHSGTNFTKISKPAGTRLCGFAIRGNHRSSANPHVEWDLNIDQIVTPIGTAGGVSAGSFDVTDHKRKPRPAITQMSFAVAGTADPIVADIRGVPNADNGIVALLQPDPASRLFAQFQTERPIVISLQYADRSSDQLEVRGFRDRRKFGGGNNSYFNQCLQGFKALVPGETITTTR
jgi:hypothetical protein